MKENNLTLGEFIIENQKEFQYSSGELSRIFISIKLAAKVVSYKVNKAELVDIIGGVGEKKFKVKTKYVLLMNPLNSSSNIEVNTSVGTIFSV